MHELKNLLTKTLFAAFAITALTSIVFSQDEKKPVSEIDDKILEQLLEKKKLPEQPTRARPSEPKERSEERVTSSRMTIERMDQILRVQSKKVVGRAGNWQIDYKGLPMIVVTDAKANRMRIISPIGESKQLKEADLRLLLKANFSTALDAKYAIFDNVLWSTYVHPLGELTEAQFKDALQQVFNLTKNFGTSYSSTAVVFGTQQKPKQEN